MRTGSGGDLSAKRACATPPMGLSHTLVGGRVTRGEARAWLRATLALLALPTLRKGCCGTRGMPTREAVRLRPRARLYVAEHAAIAP